MPWWADSVGGTQYSAIAHTTNNWTYWYDSGAITATKVNDNNRYGGFRHGGNKINNVIFIDGHVQAMQKDPLKKLHKKYEFYDNTPASKGM